MNDEYNLSTKTKANVQKSMPKTSTSKACKTPPRQRASPDACLYLTKNKQNEVINKNNIQQFLSDRTTEIAIPISAPFAVSDLISSDMMEVLFKLGGN